MISGNLSHETYVDDPAYLEGLTEGVDYHAIVYENWLFTKTEKKINRAAPITRSIFMLPEKDADGNVIDSTRGVIPRILMTLLAERKKTKKLMAKEKDPFKNAILDAAQLAYKVCPFFSLFVQKSLCQRLKTFFGYRMIEAATAFTLVLGISFHE